MRSGQSYRKENTNPKSIRQQNESNARRFVNGAMRKVAKHFAQQNDSTSDDGNGDEPGSPRKPIHSMVLLVLNEVSDQHNDQGGTLKNTAAEKPKLTILGLNVDTINHIMGVVAEQYATDDREPNDRECINHLVTQIDDMNMTLLECVEEFINSQKEPSQPTRSTETSQNVQINMTPGVGGNAVVAPAFSSRRTPASAENMDDDSNSDNIVIGRASDDA